MPLVVPGPIIRNSQLHTPVGRGRTATKLGLSLVLQQGQLSSTSNTMLTARRKYSLRSTLFAIWGEGGVLGRQGDLSHEVN